VYKASPINYDASTGAGIAVDRPGAEAK